MFYNFNDYELLYLIKDGIFEAREMLYYKYSFLIKKLYFEGYQKYFSFLDFNQECLVLLEELIKQFDVKKEVSFYSFYIICLKRFLGKAYYSNSLRLQEIDTVYQREAGSFLPNPILKKALKDIMEEDLLSKQLVEECLLGKVSLKRFCEVKQLKYYKTYYKYKKIVNNLEKLLTK